LTEDKHVDKTSELVKDIKTWVDEEYASGRVTVMTDEEMVACITRLCLEKGYTIGQ